MTDFIKYCRKGDCGHCPFPRLESNDPHCSCDPSYYLEMELERSAQAKGIGLAQGVLPYLITHYRRDMRSLSSMLGELDHYSLETKRPITLPLLRELLQRDHAE